MIEGEFEDSVSAKADPQQADDAQIDVIDQRQVFVTLGVLNLVVGETSTINRPRRGLAFPVSTSGAVGLLIKSTVMWVPVRLPTDQRS